MTDRQEASALEARLHEGLIKEAARRVMELPQYAGADAAAVRDLVESEINKGNITLYGLLRSAKSVV